MYHFFLCADREAKVRESQTLWTNVSLDLNGRLSVAGQNQLFGSTFIRLEACSHIGKSAC